MDCLIIRTKLQALIALTLIESGIINEGFCLIKLFQYSNQEDDDSVYQAYDRVSIYSGRVEEIVQSKGFFRAYWRCSLALLRVYLTRGRVFFAGVDFYPLAVSAKQFRGIQLCTFDDGLANTLETSKYYLSEPLPPKGVRRAILRILFPQGAQKFFRSRIEKHYTIYKNKTNIVNGCKLIYVDFNWSKNFEQKDYLKFKNEVKSILIGTAFNAYKEIGVDYINPAKMIISSVELFIPHPRDNEFESSPNFVRFNSPAESVLLCLASQSKTKINVFHFNSTVALSLEGLCQDHLVFIDLCEKSNRCEYLPNYDTAEN